MTRAFLTCGLSQQARGGRMFRAGSVTPLTRTVNGPIHETTATAAHSLASPAEALFLDNLHVVERILAVLARRHSLSVSDAEEFASWARARLIDDGYAILRKFGGRSSLATYLSVVLSNLFRDFRNSRWGRWRPSSAASRLGPFGIRLDELLHRDGCTLREAIAIMRSAGATLSDAEFAALASRLPAHSLSREVPLAPTVPSAAGAPAGVERTERDRIDAALDAAIATLSDEDRLITQMRFWNGSSVADIARALHLEQKPLYRRLADIQKRLRVTLAQHGIGETQAREVLTDEGAW